METIMKKLINLPKDVSEVQLSIDESHEMMEEKVIKPEKDLKKKKGKH